MEKKAVVRMVTFNTRKSHTRVFAIVLMFAILFLLPLVHAETSYPQTGGVNTDFLGGVGGFDTTVLSTTKIRPLNNGDHVALVDDLDGDGTNEIVVVDGGSIKLFRGPNLDVVDTFNLISGNYSPAIINDIDGDGFKEIIIANEIPGDGTITILEYNGSVLKNQSELSFTNFPDSGVGGTQEVLLQCSDDRGGTEAVTCLFTVTNSPVSTTKTFLAGAFNASNVSSSGIMDIVFSSGMGGFDVCLPMVPTMTFTDFDNDGRGEFIVSTTIFDVSADETLLIHYFDVVEALNDPVEDLRITYSSSFNPVTTTQNCAPDNMGRFFSSPILGDFDSSPSNGLETVISISEDADDFVIKVFDSLGNDIDTHPAIATADGELLGNPMIANIFGDTGSNDYCAFGQDTTEQVIKLLCGSQLTGRTILGLPVNNIEFGFDISETFNLSSSYNFPNTIAHMANMQEDSIDVTDQVGFNDPSELVVAHGVFQVSADDFTGAFTGNQMNRLFERTSESACMIVDAEKVGASDIICVKDFAVEYINDNLVNGVAAITAHTENPCIDSGPVQINTTFQVRLTAQDQNPSPLPQDLVTTTVKIYEGTDNEQVSILPNQTSGEEVVHLFSFPTGGINQTGTNIRLVYEAFETGNPSSVDSIAQTFTVSSAGVQFGDCTSGEIIGIPGEEPEALTPEDLAGFIPDDQADNGITSGLITLSSLLGLGGTTIWLVIMIAISIGVWGAVMSIGNGISGSSALGVIAIINTLMIILGARLGIFSTGLVVIIVTISVVIIGVFMGRFATGLRTETG